MQGHVILSHGFETGPDSTKVTALAAIAERRGWRTSRVDYRDLDARGLAECVAPRVERLLHEARPGERTILAGSSMGAFVSGLASLQTTADALFLLALPLQIPGFGVFDAARVPTSLVHGWDDETCPASEVLAFAHEHRASLLMLPDTHRLADHVELIGDHFNAFLRAIETVSDSASLPDVE